MEKNTMNKNDKIKLAIIGCGSVSEMYLDFLSKQKEIILYGCADLNKNLALKAKKKYQIEKIMSAEEAIIDKNVDIILNLTNPQCHFEINLKALKNKKSVFSEKPFALDYKKALKLVDIAKKNKLLLYSAPDTYLSRGIYTAKFFLEKNFIGKALSAVIISSCPPIENWHPNPDFLYKKGGGPLYDRGIYFLTTLVYLFGPIAEVFGYCNNFIPKRYLIKNNKKTMIRVETPTHYSVQIKLKNGMTISSLLSFDIKAIPDESDSLQIFGSDGSLKLPNLMLYSGQTKYYDSKNSSWLNIKNINHGYDMSGDVRGAAILDMISCYKINKRSYDNIEIATHVIGVLNAIDRSSKTAKRVKITSMYKKII